MASLGCDGSLRLGSAQGQSLGPWGRISLPALLSPLCALRGWCHATELTTAPRPPEGSVLLRWHSPSRVWAGVHALVVVASTPVRAGPGSRLAPCPRVCTLSLATVASALVETSAGRARGAGAGAWCGPGGHPEVAPRHFATSRLCAVGSKQTCACAP